MDWHRMWNAHAVSQNWDSLLFCSEAKRIRIECYLCVAVANDAGDGLNLLLARQMLHSFKKFIHKLIRSSFEYYFFVFKCNFPFELNASYFSLERMAEELNETTAKRNINLRTKHFMQPYRNKCEINNDILKLIMFRGNEKEEIILDCSV